MASQRREVAPRRTPTSHLRRTRSLSTMASRWTFSFYPSPRLFHLRLEQPRSPMWSSDKSRLGVGSCQTRYKISHITTTPHSQTFMSRRRSTKDSPCLQTSNCPTTSSLGRLQAPPWRALLRGMKSMIFLSIQWILFILLWLSFVDQEEMQFMFYMRLKARNLWKSMDYLHLVTVDAIPLCAWRTAPNQIPNLLSDFAHLPPILLSSALFEDITPSATTNLKSLCFSVMNSWST